MTPNIFLFLADAQASTPMSLLIPVLMFAGMFFLLIAPQRKRQKAHEKMVKELSAGADVIVAGGIYGTITEVKPDRFVVKVSENSKLEILKSAIQSKVDMGVAVAK